MSYLNLLKPELNSTPKPIQQVPFTDFTEVLITSFPETFRNFGIMSKQSATAIEMGANLRRYKNLSGGRRLEQDAINWLNDPVLVEDMRKKTRNGEIRTNELVSLIDDYVLSIKTNPNSRFRNVLTQSEIDDVVKNKAKESLMAAQMARAGASGFASIAGTLTGGVLAGFTDLPQILTMGIGASFATGILKTAVIEAGINVGVEIVATPFIAQWQRELNQEFGIKEVGANLGFAALFGAGVGGFTKFVGKAVTGSSAYRMRMLQEALESQNELNTSLQAAMVSKKLYIEDAKPRGVELDDFLRGAREVEESIEEVRPNRLAEMFPEWEEKLRTGLVEETQKRVKSRIFDETPVDKEFSVEAQENKKPTIGDNIKDPHAPEIGNETFLRDLVQSPEFIARQAREIEALGKRKGFKGDDDILLDDEGILIDDKRVDKMTFNEIVETIKEDEVAIKAINFCTTGKK